MNSKQTEAKRLSQHSRQNRLVVLVNDEEMDKIDELACEAGLSRGAYIRHRVLYRPTSDRDVRVNDP